MDDTGAIYVSGTTSGNLSASNEAVQSQYAGYTDGFIVKFAD